ncbi:MAG: hypothetical protein IPN44_10630 [Flavobacteriales bacterium]|nr:hypothetical protein [Flavobacteriales bacterium]
MNSTPIIALSLAALLVTACGTANTTPEGHAPGAAEMGNEHESHGGVVQLNNGQPWVANTETTDGVNRMLVLVKDYDPDKGDGALLKEKLTVEFNEIFEKCTMTGEAHVQLHNYLTPVHGMLDKLSTKPTAADLSELSAYLGTYGKYFK